MSNARFGAAAIVAAVAFVAAIVCGAVRATAAGGYSDTPTANWFRSLTVPGSGVSCCDQADCHPVRTDFRDGAWWVESRVTGTWLRIPADRVLSTPSIFQNGVLCEVESDPGPPPGVFIYCFAPPPLGF